MFADFRSLLIGSIAAFAAPTCVAFISNSPAVAVIGFMLAVLGGLRLLGMKVYERRKADIRRVVDLKKWENLYVAGAALHVTLMGIFCLATFIQPGDEFGKLMSTAGAMAYFVGIPGRNFASNKLVNTLIVCGALPIICALIIAGGSFWLISIFVLLPFFIAMRRISFRLRDIYLDTVLKARDISYLADQFDAALNNMPHGLAMLSASGEIVVINSRLNHFLKTNLDPRRCHHTLIDLFEDAEIAGRLDNQSQETAKQLALWSSTSFGEEHTLELLDGRILSVKCQPMGNGGAVLVFEDITEGKLAQQRINQLARFDSLTGLPNRAEFLEQAEAILKSSILECESALMFLDLDQFKQVNDTLGHAIGDMLLCQVAKRLLNQIRKNDLVARFGGDEFVILLREISDRNDAQFVAAAIIEVLSKPYEIEDHLLQITASIGISFTPVSSLDVGPLLRDADMALYQAKADGRGRSRVFELEMEEKVRTRQLLELDFREALTHNHFELHYQPIYNIDSKTFTICEALLRWKHPIRGWVSPGVFVPLAEEMGLIGELDDWVLRRACLDCGKWPREVRVAVNISATHFRDAKLAQTIVQALQSASLPAERLCIEITETALLSNILTARSNLSQLSQLGVSIALDDFGTGYSSLSYLHSLPLNKVKIDRSFLLDLEKSERVQNLLAAVVRLSVDLGLEVVIEGVETPEEFALICAKTQVDAIQGFLFARPMPGSLIPKFLEAEIRFAA